MLLQFERSLASRGCSRSMIGKVRTSLGSIIALALDQGQVARNVVRERGRLKRGQFAEGRSRRKLEIGADIPTPREVARILRHAEPRWRPLLATAAMTGLRASELRGLRWADVDLKAQRLHVRQRADRYNEMGCPKTATNTRTVDLPRHLATILREWKLAAPNSELVFPNGRGNVETLSNIMRRGFLPAQVAGNVVTSQGKAKYTGLHSLRHFFATERWTEVENFHQKTFRSCSVTAPSR